MTILPLADLDLLLSVSLIMTPRASLRCVQLGHPAGEVRSLFEPDFDQLPVVRGDQALGVLTRASIEQLEDHETIDFGHAVEKVPVLLASAPLADAIGALVESHSLLVVDERGFLEGLVHYSDLNRHPTRLLFYFLLAGLEMALARAILEVFGQDEEWLKQLSPPRQIQVLGITEWERREDIRIDMVEATELKDVVEVVLRVKGVQEALALTKETTAWLKGLVPLRNATMHPVRRMVRRAKDVRGLHEQLTRLRELGRASLAPRL